MKISYLLFLLMFLSQFAGHAQTTSPFVEHISIEQGLLQSTVNCIMQDDKGFIWFGTNDGLNRYDGYTFRTFRNIPADINSPADNYVTALTEDQSGNIWVGTASGTISRYDPSLQKFENYKLKLHPLFRPAELPEDIPQMYSGYTYASVTSILCDKFGYIWAGTLGSGLFQFDPDTKIFTQFFYTKGDNSISSDNVLSIAEGKKTDLWIGTFKGGLNKLTARSSPDKSRLNFTFLNYTSGNGNGHLSNNNVSTLIVSDSTLWIGTYGGGINYVNINQALTDTSFSHLVITQDDRFGNRLITKIFREKDYLWVGTIGAGLYKYNLKSRSFVSFRHDPLNKNSMDGNDIMSMSADSSGIIWAASLSGFGVNKINPSKFRLFHFKNDPIAPNSLTDDHVSAFAEDVEGNIWIGTVSGGVNKFVRKNNSFENFRYNENDTSSTGRNYVTSLLADDKKIWIGTFNNGISLYNENQKKFIILNYTELSSNKITCFAKDEQGAVWAGTANAGLNKIYFEGNKIRIRHYRSSKLFPATIPENSILSIFVDNQKQLRIVTTGGYIAKYDYTADDFTYSRIVIKDFPDLRISCLNFSGSYAWIGTNAGILKYNTDIDRIEAILSPPAIKNKIIAAIQKYKNELWISTNYGIVKLNLSNSSMVFFNVNDGLQSLKYTIGASVQTTDGEIFFGGINGFNSFYPDSLYYPYTSTGTFITSFRTLNRELPAGSEIISLSPYQNSIDIEFASQDFTDPVKNQFMYKLSGYDEDWKYLSGGDHNAAYNDLPPGEYIFKLKGANSSGIWDVKPIELKIQIAQVFWKTWWFILITCLLAAGALTYFIYLRFSQYLAIEKLKSRISADLHDSIGSGLTEISLLSELTQRDISSLYGTSLQNLSVISARSRELIDNMSDIVWLVNPRPSSIYDLVLRLKEIYYPLLSACSIDIKMEIPESFRAVKLNMEERQNVYLIFKEAINNSLKYSKAKCVIFNVEAEDGFITINLKDNGCGFSVEANNGNGLINMKRRAEAINAELRIISSYDDGTAVTLNLKL